MPISSATAEITRMIEIRDQALAESIDARLAVDVRQIARATYSTMKVLLELEGYEEETSGKTATAALGKAATGKPGKKKERTRKAAHAQSANRVRGE